MIYIGWFSDNDIFNYIILYHLCPTMKISNSYTELRIQKFIY